MAAADRASVLERARGYPYVFPRRSFIYEHGAERPFDRGATEGRTPVLAFGSNQSPLRLAQKFGHDASHRIPVERGVLQDFDVVYSAHLTSYGATPAMLQVSPGARVEIAVTWLDDRQLEIMHETEILAANYSFAALDGVRLTLEGGSVHDIAFAYVGARGHLVHDDTAVALAAIRCEGRRFPALRTAEALEIVRRLHAPERDPEEFVLRVVAEPDYRRRVTEALAAGAVPFGYPARRLA